MNIKPKNEQELISPHNITKKWKWLPIIIFDKFSHLAAMLENGVRRIPYASLISIRPST